MQQLFGVNADDRAELDLVGRLLETRTGGHDHLFQGLQFLWLFVGFGLRLCAGLGLRCPVPACSASAAPAGTAAKVMSNAVAMAPASFSRTSV